MSDLIRRQDAIEALKIAYWDEGIQSAKNDPCIIDVMTDWAIRQIKNLSSTEPERKRGKWIPIESQTVNGRCSVCGYESHLYENDVYGEYYCPNCGAYMRDNRSKNETN